MKYVRICKFIYFALALTVMISGSIRAENWKEGGVFILNSYHQGYDWSDTEVGEAIKTLNNLGYKSDIYVENLDRKRVSDTVGYAEYVALFKIKYGKTKIACIIACDEAAFDFAMQYRDILFNSAPVVFCGVVGRNPVEIKKRGNVTGIFGGSSPYKTLELAMKLHPDRNTVYYISDSTETASAFKQILLDEIKKTNCKVNLQLIDNPGIEELKLKLNSLDDKAIVFIGLMIRDKDGEVYTIDHITRIISSSTNAPVYGMWRNMPGCGIVGGYINGSDVQGQSAAKMAFEIINGAKAQDIPIILVPPYNYMFDRNQLNRFSIKDNQLPENKIIINNKPTVYQVLINYIWVPLSVFVLLVSVIVILMINAKFKRKSAAELKKSEENYRMIMEEAGDPILITDALKRIILANTATSELTGYSHEELISMNYSDIFDKEELLARPLNIEGLNHGEVVVSERKINKKNGENLFVETSSRQMPNNYVQSIFRNVHSRKLVESERLTFIKALKNKNAEMERFIYTISHDLRSPIITIKGFLGLSRKNINSGNLETLANNLNRIESAADKMANLLNDLLELSRIGRVGVNYTEFNMLDAVNEAFELTQGYLNEKQITFDFDAKMPLVKADKNRIVELWQNLIENSIKYMGNQQNKIIYAGLLHKNDEVIFYLKDTGIGIEQDYLNRIFNLFEKLDTSTPGTGVGLAIVKRIIEYHSGRIWADSDGLGLGSTFYFTLDAPNMNENLL